MAGTKADQSARKTTGSSSAVKGAKVKKRQQHSPHRVDPVGLSGDTFRNEFNTCLCDLSDSDVSDRREASGHLKSCTRHRKRVTSTLASKRPVMVDLADSDSDENDSPFLARAKAISGAPPRHSGRAPLGARILPRSPASYNPKTVARDILRAAGIHPTEAPLNWRLLQTSHFTSGR